MRPILSKHLREYQAKTGTDNDSMGHRYFWLFVFSCVAALNAEINLTQIKNHRLETHPYQWTMIDQLFDRQQAFYLTETYPSDHYKSVDAYDNEKGYRYEVRSLIPMGKDQIAFSEQLSPSWRQLALDLLSTDYRDAISQLTGIDLQNAPMEANLFHYGPGSWMGPHLDLKEKLVTHILYFNSKWDVANGGCLAILQTKNMADSVCLIPPIVGNSAVLVRSNHSWHAVLPISNQCHTSRRCMTVTFYHPQSISTMWPPKENPKLHTYP